MITVALVTTWDEHCGIAEYAKNLIQSMHDADVKITVVARPLVFESVFERTKGFDIVHFNYSANVFTGFSNEELVRFKRQKTVVTFHDSLEERIWQVSRLGLFDKIVVHERPNFGPAFPDNVVYIPQGIRLADVQGIKKQRKLGIAGFPLPWKGFTRVAQRAKIFGLGCLAIMPSTDHVHQDEVKKEILSIHPDAEVITDWLTHEAVVKRMAECCIAVFPYEENKVLYGTSAAVGFGLASGSPVIVSRNRQFIDLAHYTDEIYFQFGSLSDTIAQVMHDIGIGEVKMPNRILKDMNWERCAELYSQVYRQIGEKL